MSSEAADGRYVRNVPVPGWNPLRLAEASVIIVGVGGLGTEVARQLAQAGVGRLVLCDPDKVEMSNLDRGALFTIEQARVGTKKVDAAKQALEALAPGAVVDSRADDFRYAIGLGELRAADLVLSCLDSVSDRIALSSRCIFSGTRLGLLDAGLHPWGGEVRHYAPDGPCYACGCSPADRALIAWHMTCGPSSEMGASAPITALVASWQASDAVRLLAEDHPPTLEILRIDAKAGQSRRIQLPSRDENCPCHATIEFQRVTATKLSTQLTVDDVLAFAGNEERVLSWNPIDRKDRWSPVTLRAADPQARLEELGIPAGEILPVVRVRPIKDVRYLALQERLP